MLENYAKDKNGVIYQVERQKFDYDDVYIQRAYGKAPVAEMSYLRLGYVIGAIGHTPASILDVGYGKGDFLKAAKNVIADVNGYDIPPAYPIEGITTVDSLYDRHYEVVTFFDSLEHFSDIYEISRLNCDYICISLPWCHYFSDEWFSNWKHRKANEHLWHFNEEALRNFFASIGFNAINTCNVEDAIRRPDAEWKNILSGVFRRV